MMVYCLGLMMDHLIDTVDGILVSIEDSITDGNVLGTVEVVVLGLLLGTTNAVPLGFRG